MFFFINCHQSLRLKQLMFLPFLLCILNVLNVYLYIRKYISIFLAFIFIANLPRVPTDGANIKFEFYFLNSFFQEFYLINKKKIIIIINNFFKSLIKILFLSIKILFLRFKILFLGIKILFLIIKIYV